MPSYSSIIKSGNADFAETSFSNLMKKRIYHVLLLSSAYDAFILEDDGRIDEQIFNEYVSLNLRYPPQFILVTDEDEAFKIMEEQNIDLVITMLSAEKESTFDFAANFKKEYPDIPIVALTPFSREVSLRFDKEKTQVFDYVFSWLGNADLLLAIIKLIEDKMNAEYDINEIGVQAIILVEDSVRFYSSYLPNIYKIIFTQSKQFMQEGLNEHQKMLRMRGRPKILFATTYEDAINLYDKFHDNLLGVITDMSYKHYGIRNQFAGLNLCRHIKTNNKYTPLLIQSSDANNILFAKEIKVGFLHKHSKKLLRDLRQFIIKHFAFGPFEFIDPHTHNVVEKAADLKEMQDKLYLIPDASLRYHITRNHFSKWLNARALFALANVFKQVSVQDFDNLDDARHFLFQMMQHFRISKGRGVIAEFNRDNYDEYLIFTRMGNGSIGGKARGLAFLDSLIKRNKLLSKFPDVLISIPRTVVLSTDFFDEFMESNDLYKIALSEVDDKKILDSFVSAPLPEIVIKNLLAFIKIVRKPIAVRSSSLLEDSHYQPFAGIYSTYMIPNLPENPDKMIQMLSLAIKSVYASAYFKSSKAYMTATSNLIDEEKMSIVFQEVTGSSHENVFYPSFSGVARSINFYPIEPEKPEDGIANIAIGLGKQIVEGGQTLRFSPKYPKKILQLSSPDQALRETQKEFYALDLNPKSFFASTDDGVNIKYIRVRDINSEWGMDKLMSTYDFQNNIIREGTGHKGKKIVTFANILKHNTFPLAEILSDILDIGEREMNTPIEIEFAVNFNKTLKDPSVFNILQIRPIVSQKEYISKDLSSIKKEDTLIYSKSALGNGVISDLHDFIFVKPETFDASKSTEIAEHINEINKRLTDEERYYILIGPGRWGSKDSWLGIPVKWPYISNARIIVESGLENYRIDPSQGTHFFQNLTSFRVGYFTINPFIDDGYYDLDYLNKMPVYYEDEFIKHIRFEEALRAEIDGKNTLGVVYKPGK
ncbi:MAG: phosphoenolpyruvate synthase [Bacteroidetes bacterium]|nr:MAG: phosphoenolpyruvate synthase [Bacteroidota bacterium]